MTLLKRALATAALLLVVSYAGAVLSATAAAADDPCQQALILIKERDAEFTENLRRLHRELAALRNELEQPGLEEIFSGIGYILGLFGVGFFVAGRRDRRQE